MSIANGITVLALIKTTKERKNSTKIFHFQHYILHGILMTTIVMAMKICSCNSITLMSLTLLVCL